MMDILELKERFYQSRNYSAIDVNELMDYAKKAYIHNEINIKDYRLIVGMLEAQGADLPESLSKEPLIEKTN